MLVVTRKQGERIRIGGEIFVSVEKIVGGKVRIGIEAPRGVLILREELIDDGDGEGDVPNGGDHANG